MNKPEDREPHVAFEEAIESGRLSLDPEEKNHVGKYMFMGRWNGKDTFKHIHTREYDV